MKDDLGKRKNYAIGTAAGAVAGFPMGILLAVAFRPSPYPFSFVISVFEYAIRGIIFGAIFIWVSDKIPTRRILTKAIIFSLLVELVLDLGLNTVIWVLFFRGIQFPLDRASASLGIFLLWGAVLGYLLEHPKLLKRLDLLHP